MFNDFLLDNYDFPDELNFPDEEWVEDQIKMERDRLMRDPYFMAYEYGEEEWLESDIEFS